MTQDMSPVSSKAPLLTVAVPTYKGQAFIGAAIASVLAQSFGDYELLILDDNSPDDTESIVRGFKDPRIHYLRNPANLGAEGNWNACLAHGRGQYFKLLPHDDLLMPDCLALQVAALQADAEQRLALTFCAREVLAPEGRVVARRGYASNQEIVLPALALMRRCIRHGTNLIGEPGGVMFRKALADRVGLFDATNPYVIDLDYWFRLLRYGNAHYLPQTLAAFRVSRQQWSVAIGSGQGSEFRSFVARVGLAGAPPVSAIDRACAAVMSTLNNWARTAFYSVYLR